LALSRNADTCSPSKVDEGVRTMTATVVGEDIPIAFGETVVRTVREPTPSELRRWERQPWISRTPLYDCAPSGRLFLTIDHFCSGLRKRWTEGKRQRLEECLGAFIAQLEIIAEQTKLDRREREEAARRRRAWEAERAAKLRAIHDEEERLGILRTQVDAWHESERLRQFARAARAAATAGRLRDAVEFERWLGWVSDQADRLDPLVTSPPSILDEKKRYASPHYDYVAASDGPPASTSPR
jgi:hypothetical protein